MNAPDEKELKLLRLVAAEPHGIIGQDDPRLAPFCDDRVTYHDTFNRCCDAGWLKAWIDSLSENHTAEITASGRAWLTMADAAAQPRS